MRRVISAALCAAALTVVPGTASAATNGQLAAGFGANSLVTLNPDGTNFRILWQAPTWNDSLSQLAWSPDGNKLAFVHWDAAHGPRIAVTDLATGVTTHVSDHPGPSDAGVTQDLDPGWTPDGRVVFRRIPPGAGSQSQQALSVAPDGSDLRELPDAPDPDYGEVLWLADGSGFYQFANGFNSPALSPDAGWLVFRSRNDHGHLVLGSLDDEDADPVDLTPGGLGQDDHDPSWSPDGTSVLYVHGLDHDYGVEEELRVVDVATRTARTVKGGNYHDPAWQPCVAGVTVSCGSPARPTCTPAGQSPVFQPAPAPCVTIVRPAPRPTFTGPTFPRAAPKFSYRNAPQLDRHGRVAVKLLCDRACTVTLHVTTRLRNGRVLNGKAVTASTTKVKGAVTVKLRRAKLPARRRVAATRVVGTVRGPEGLSRRLSLLLD